MPLGQREPEIAIRLALGASRRHVTRLFLSGTVRVVAAGTATGIAGAAVVGRTLQSQLHGVSTFDLSTVLVTSTAVAAAALLAAWWPVRRTAKMNPGRLLKNM